jgi:hypothetical protein
MFTNSAMLFGFYLELLRMSLIVSERKSDFNAGSAMNQRKG